MSRSNKYFGRNLKAIKKEIERGFTRKDLILSKGILELGDHCLYDILEKEHTINPTEYAIDEHVGNDNLMAYAVAYKGKTRKREPYLTEWRSDSVYTGQAMEDAEAHSGDISARGYALVVQTQMFDRMKMEKEYEIFGDMAAYVRNHASRHFPKDLFGK